MKITYISHSGFAVELENHIFLFDYYKGEISEGDCIEILTDKEE